MSRDLLVAVCLAGLLCVGCAGGGETGGDASFDPATVGSGDVWACTRKTWLREVTADEARCLCERNVARAESFSRECLGDAPYEAALASCEQASAYSASCDVAVREPLDCTDRTLSLECSELEQFVLDDVAGCATLSERVNACRGDAGL